MSKQSDGDRSGRIDRSRINATTQDEIERQAEQEFTALGLSDNLGKPYTVFNSPAPDIKQLRDTLRCSQSEFAERFGLSLRTVQQWEQRRSTPDQPARILLTTIEADPDAVARAASIAIWRARDRKRVSANSELSLSNVLSLVNRRYKASVDRLKSTSSPRDRASGHVQSDPNESKRFVA
jgi:putative transcriptional regulator